MNEETQIKHILIFRIPPNILVEKEEKLIVNSAYFDNDFTYSPKSIFDSTVFPDISILTTIFVIYYIDGLDTMYGERICKVAMESNTLTDSYEGKISGYAYHIEPKWHTRREFVGVEEVEVVIREIDFLAEVLNVKETSIGILVSNVPFSKPAINKIISIEEGLFLICQDNYLDELLKVLEKWFLDREINT
ncbi:7765_t:CDS:2 [Dentiscutata erythropus]|uniref:7765_t:CDS:1 n=1 Tax=Dentiscutata erythropus TaxID=1348616 RepID=A0A9N9DMY2_9GLOM|nr:7765_t:CDS:2 [Dentiscutata erythropus]